MNSNLTRRDIITRVCEKTGHPQKDVRDIVQAVLDVIADAFINGQDVELRNFGIFKIKETKPRVGRNPSDPIQLFTIPASKNIKFKLGKDIREKLNVK